MSSMPKVFQNIDLTLIKNSSFIGKYIKAMFLVFQSACFEKSCSYYRSRALMWEKLLGLWTKRRFWSRYLFLAHGRTLYFGHLINSIHTFCNIFRFIQKGNLWWMWTRTLTSMMLVLCLLFLHGWWALSSIFYLLSNNEKHGVLYIVPWIFIRWLQIAVWLCAMTATPCTRSFPTKWTPWYP